jgi:Na+/melibiose symporter-like transporter
MGYLFDRAVFGKQIANAILASRFLFGFIAVCLMMIVAVFALFYWIYKEIALELSYKHRYGAKWKAEFELYHGSVSQAHSKILGIIICMIALAAVLSWAYWQLRRKHKYRSHHHRA